MSSSSSSPTNSAFAAYPFHDVVVADLDFDSGWLIAFTVLPLLCVPNDDVVVVVILAECETDVDAFLRALHHVLFDVQVLEGSLCCSESGQVFPIAEGIADMMLPEAVV